MMSEVPPRFPIRLTIATAISLGILISLGMWQVQRMQWKEGLLAQVAALKNAAPVPAAQALALGATADFTRVELECPGLAAAPFVELYSIRDGQAGSRLISACALAAGPYRSVLVDRGFVADVISARPPVDPASATPVRVTGVLRAPDPRSRFAAVDDVAGRRFYTRDIAAIAGVLGAEAPAPLFVAAESASNPEWPALVPAPLPAEIPNNHLQYVITWFGLAAALVGVYAALLLRTLKPQ